MTDSLIRDKVSYLLTSYVDHFWYIRISLPYKNQLAYVLVNSCSVRILHRFHDNGCVAVHVYVDGERLEATFNRTILSIVLSLTQQRTILKIIF